MQSGLRCITPRDPGRNLVLESSMKNAKRLHDGSVFPRLVSSQSLSIDESDKFNGNRVVTAVSRAQSPFRVAEFSG